MEHDLPILLELHLKLESLHYVSLAHLGVEASLVLEPLANLEEALQKWLPLVILGEQFAKSRPLAWQTMSDRLV